MRRSALALAAAAVIIALRVRAFNAQQQRQRREWARDPAEWTQHLMSGGKKPADIPVKEFMYKCFKRDVERGRSRNADIPQRSVPRNGMRVVTFNVHFLCAGYSEVVLYDSEDEVTRVVRTLDADVLLLQEVPESRVRPLSHKLARELGYAHSVAAGSADVHVLDSSVARFGGERLHVLVLSRWPFRDSAAVPMGPTGHAAFAEVLAPRGNAIAGASSSDAVVPVHIYSAHLSVRCPPNLRRHEITMLLRHAAKRSAAQPTAAGSIIAGDLNQANEDDYPHDEWAAMAADMRFAGLPLDDGVRAAQRAAGFINSFDMCGPIRAVKPATSAWNGALVDGIHVRTQQHDNDTGWNTMRCSGSWVFSTMASDHLPLVADFNF